MKWYVGADHGGFQLKQHLVAYLREQGDEVVDLGTDSEASVDYPNFGKAVGEKVAGDPGSYGLVACGTGIGISIAANKVRGIRAAVVHDSFTAEMARAHNNANVIALGGRVIGSGVAEHAVATFRKTEFAGGGRHQRRVDQLTALDSGK